MSEQAEAPVPARGWRTFVALWGSQSVSHIGSYVSWFAVSIYVAQTLYPAPEQQAQLAFAVGALAMVAAVTGLLVAPFAGAYADRHDRRRTMLACDLISGTVAALLAALMLLGPVPLWLLLALVATLHAVDGFHEAAFDSSFAMLLTREQLGRANGMMQTTRSVAGMVGPGLAAALIALPGLLAPGRWAPGSGVPFTFMVDAVSFFGAALVLSRLSIPSPVQEPAQPGVKKPSVVADFRTGWQYLRRRPPLLLLLLTFSALNFAVVPMSVYQSLLTKFHLAPDWAARGMSFEAALAVLVSSASVGTFVGGLIVSAWGGLKQRRIYGVLVPALVMTGMLVALGLSSTLPLSAAALFVFGVAFPFAAAHTGSIWQSQVPRELQGRVFSVRRVLARSVTPASIALVTALSARFDPAQVVLWLGGLAAAVMLVQLLNPVMHRVDQPEPEAQPVRT